MNRLSTTDFQLSNAFSEFPQPVESKASNNRMYYPQITVFKTAQYLQQYTYRR